MTADPPGEVATEEDFHCSLRFRSTVEKVFDAIAKPGGENGWWSTSGGVAKEQGELLRLDWLSGDFISFRIDEFDPPYSMVWICTDQSDRNLPRPDEWVGTSLRFQVRASGDETLVEFEHLGLSAELDCFDICKPGWNFFLRHSLSRLIETGRGMPFDAREDS